MRHNLPRLEIFMAMAEQRNLTKASQLCHLVTSAVSKRICELEERVGSPFVIRYARGMELSPAWLSMRHYMLQVNEVLQKMDLYRDSQNTRGHNPAHLAISPDYMYVANEDSDSIAIFIVDPATGSLTSTDDVIETRSPVCMVFAGTNV